MCPARSVASAVPVIPRKLRYDITAGRATFTCLGDVGILTKRPTRAAAKLRKDTWLFRPSPARALAACFIPFPTPVEDSLLSKSDAELRSHIASVLDSAYELDKEIGRGGMGIVF